ncbi:hypothetical protein SUDANB178_00282 [Streptomyces sp. enrichment culture]
MRAGRPVVAEAGGGQDVVAFALSGTVRASDPDRRLLTAS